MGIVRLANAYKRQKHGRKEAAPTFSSPIEQRIRANDCKRVKVRHPYAGNNIRTVTN